MLDARTIISFFKTSSGKFVLLIIAVMVGLFIFSQIRPYLTPSIPQKGNSFQYKNREINYQGNTEAYNPGDESRSREATQKEDKRKLVQEKNELMKPYRATQKNLDSEFRNMGRATSQGNDTQNQGRIASGSHNNSMTLNLYTSREGDSKRPLDVYAPYGRKIECQLVNTVDTSNAATPIIGVVIKPVWSKGRIIIPVGTEVHGWAQGSPVRDKIMTQNNWVLVWRIPGPLNGKEMKVQGIALEDGQIAGKKQWMAGDGSAGILGYTVDKAAIGDLLSIAATFIAGVGQGAIKSTLTTTGTVTNQTFGGNVKDMLGQGTNRAATMLAQRMLERIKKDGFYVRAPAGTPFCIYVTQTLDMDNAKVGLMDRK